MITRHYVNSQNTIIYFEDIDFWPKIYLMLYPSLENSITHITCWVMVILAASICWLIIGFREFAKVFTVATKFPTVFFWSSRFVARLSWAVFTNNSYPEIKLWNQLQLQDSCRTIAWQSQGSCKAVANSTTVMRQWRDSGETAIVARQLWDSRETVVRLWWEISVFCLLSFCQYERI